MKNYKKKYKNFRTKLYLLKKYGAVAVVVRKAVATNKNK